jgi:putative lipoprotein
MGEQVIETEGRQVPIPFSVSYDASTIEDSHTYSLRVRIEDGAGKLLFINDTSVPVITRGNPTQDVEVIVVPVGG